MRLVLVKPGLLVVAVAAGVVAATAAVAVDMVAAAAAVVAATVVAGATAADEEATNQLININFRKAVAAATAFLFLHSFSGWTTSAANL
jgi:hypothetical protein